MLESAQIYAAFIACIVHIQHLSVYEGNTMQCFLSGTSVLLFFDVRDTIYRITDELGDGVRLSTYDILKFILYF